MSFAPIVKRVAPAVVNVYATRVVRQQATPPMFLQLLNPFGWRATPRVLQSLGSGVIIAPDGLVVTNFHVIAGADEVKVALADKREFPARIVLRDESSDLAVLRIEGGPGNFSTLQFADSDGVQVGDLVLAIGDPLGVGQTVTSGIVSAVARAPDDSSGQQYFIQTDAAINQGNSGGALVDMSGRLIGINSMIVTPSGGSVGLGFAIPSNLVRVVTAQAATGVIPRRPWLGATLKSITPDDAAKMANAPPTGVIVRSVDPASPAAAANLKSGDVIVSIDKAEVDDISGLNYRLATKGVGGSAELGVMRDGKLYPTSIQLLAAPEDPPRDQRTLSGNSPLAGLTVLNLSPAVADELSFPGDPRGVIVGDVSDGSPASDLGFQRGDVIASVNGTAIESTKQLADLASAAKRRWDLRFSRGGRVASVTFVQ
jgi:Do/DeqQ family serine protease